MKRLILGLTVLLMATTGFVAHSTAALSLYQEAGDYTVKLFGFTQLDIRTRDQSNGNEGLYFSSTTREQEASYLVVEKWVAVATYNGEHFMGRHFGRTSSTSRGTSPAF